MDNLSFLLVDDDFNVLEILKLNIESKFPHSVINSFTSSPEAIKLIENGLNPDIVIVDLNMPDINGLKLTQLLLSILPSLKIILYSGIIDEVEFVKNIQIGFIGILQKPSSVEDIYLEIKKAMETDRQVNTEFVNYELTHAVSHSHWEFDLFVILAGIRNVKLFNKGDIIDHAKIENMSKFDNVKYSIKLSDYLSISTCLFSCIFVSQIPINLPLACGIYLKEKNGFKEIIGKDTVATNARMQVLNSRGIIKVYVEKQFESIFILYAENILNGKIKDIELNRETKINLILSIASKKILTILNDPCHETISDIWSFSNVIIRYLEDDKTAILDMINFNKENSSKAHVLNVATVSANILLYFESIRLKVPLEKKIRNLSKKLIYSNEMKKNLTVAALLHDLGNTLIKKKTSYVPVDCPHQQRSDEINEVCYFLSNINFIPEKIIQIIGQHDERFDGSGPKKLLEPEIDLYAQILIVADQFDKLVLANKSKQEAIFELKTEKSKYNPIIVHALKETILEN